MGTKTTTRTSTTLVVVVTVSVAVLVCTAAVTVWSGTKKKKKKKTKDELLEEGGGDGDDDNVGEQNDNKTNKNNKSRNTCGSLNSTKLLPGGCYNIVFDDKTGTMADKRRLSSSISFGMEDVEKVFKESAEMIKKTIASLPNSDKLALYGLYKQATVGDYDSGISIDNNRDTPVVSLEGMAKVKAWKGRKGLSKLESMKEYVMLVERLLNNCDSNIMEHLLSGGASSSASRKDDYETAATGGIGGAPAVSRPLVAAPVPNDDEDYDECHGPGNKLLRAARHGDLDTIRTLLSSSSSSSSSEPSPLHVDYSNDDDGQTALHIACDAGLLNVVTCLVNEYNANVNAADVDGISPLQTAVIAGHVHLCKYLLTAGRANPNSEDNDGDTPRSCALDEGTDEMKELFMNLG